ncbi:MAG: hypothetical protein ACE5NW_13610 [Acidiferrobacterales bacterium]
MNFVIACCRVIVIVTLVTACAPWAMIKEPLVEGPGKSFTIELPIGWVRAKFVPNAILATRDGIGIQFIEVVKRSHDNAFPRIKEKTEADMLPSEVAELVIAEIKTDERLSGLKVVRNAPATIGGKTGFRLHLRMKNEDGLRYEAVVYGFVDEAGFYRLAFQAPAIHYFKRDLPAFEEVVKSFHLTGQSV